ncbi:DUF1003 domain-containing protein [Acidicapsa acidisoli]|uniref:DUF1003 domain-containing protein n=1 Tax=Acidicapsa acidisoli TaxID=1615681 RepID=UPI0021E0F405|nr:DUF1003 domain-containing protein [Acidicapsa acidisoli]
MAKANGQIGKTAAVEAETPKVVATPLNRLALWITTRVGSMGFFLLVFIWTACWLLWNMFAPKSIRFDPYPGFVLWLFISNMIQLFLMPLIMIGQNLQGRGAEERAKNDYKVNRKAETEIQEIKAQLKEVLERLEEIKRANKDQQRGEQHSPSIAS